MAVKKMRSNLAMGQTSVLRLAVYRLRSDLGHETDAMSRRYAGAVRQQTAASMMPKYASA